jgi:hypothetical protein
MESDINQMILDKINESDEEEWVKDFAKKALSFERSQYVEGGEYTDFYESTAKSTYDGDKE